MGLIVTFQYLRKGYQEDRARPFTFVHGGWMRDNKCKLKQEFQARYNENFFCYEDSQVLEQVVRRGCAMSVLTGFQG